ncbi:hypothetical protein G5714_024513 [Onychostoma macrolepis]|uniref:Uncharacterized protein n=1 Tax=Onychostoma macrolepis TaxID=369639 RepID=A0A7J6BMG7_9TELE|nr:hypothetical protein G5714_024513 [Onychostoma macrolepis]
MNAKGGLKVKFQIGTWCTEWEVFVAPIRDPVLLGLDFLQAANVTIHTSGRVFIAEELVPAKIVGGDGTDYHVARVVLETDTMLPPESECLVWGEVDNPKPGVCAVLEPYLITETVASGSVVTTMERRVIVRRQRSEILQKSKGTPDNPIMQEPLHEPEPPSSQGSSETESISSDPEPQENQDKERKRQPAARRRRKKLGVGLMSDIGEQETIKKTHKGREIRKPARYNS